MDVVGHHELARPEITQVEHERAELACGVLDRCVELVNPGSRAGPAEIERRRQRQCALTAVDQELERDRVIARERPDVEARTAHVVDADVQAAELVARRGMRRVGLERRDLRLDDVTGVGAVDGVTREREPEATGGPQRPGLQRHPPLELAPTVRDRVAEGEHAERQLAGVACANGQGRELRTSGRTAT